MEIWYNKKELYILETNEKYLENIFPIGENKIMFSSNKKMLCFQFDDKRYNKVLQVNISENNHLYLFFPNIYKKK